MLLQVRNSHDELIAQLTSHAHESPQSTPRHEFWPVHFTSQSPVPHSMLRHEP